MNFLSRRLVAMVLGTAFAGTPIFGIATGSNGLAFAACFNLNNTQLTFNLPKYPFWKLAAEEMEQCGNVKVIYGYDAIGVTPDPLVPDRDLGSLVGVSNASLARLTSQGLLRPLDELVERHRARIADRQLIRVDGKVMAIAVTANTKALLVHGDLFRQEEITIPDTYEAFIDAADRLKGSELYSNSFSLAYRPGWNLTQEFIDQFLAVETLLIGADNKPLINNETGIATLERMKVLASYLPENYLEADSAKVLEDLLAFRAPMSVTWASSMGAIENPAVSRVAGKMLMMPAPSVVPGGRPAATLWWDGFAIPLSASTEEANAAFITALEGLDSDMLAKHRNEALWIVKAYLPGKLTENLLAAIDRGIPTFPDSEAVNVLHRSLSPHIEAFIKGKTSAAEALREAEADYLQIAKERGVSGL